jgi:hypothetical protein
LLDADAGSFLELARINPGYSLLVGSLKDPA